MFVTCMNGWLNLYKPIGLTSNDALMRAKRILRPIMPKKHKIGHAGTLDPLADGVLPIAIGDATKTVQFAMDKLKTYQFTIMFGEARSTDDAEGEVVETSDKRPALDQVRAIIPQFTGAITQVPPAFSAIKINGERAYNLARAGEIVEMPEREVYVQSIEICHPEYGDGVEKDALVSEIPQHSVMLRAVTGKGTYIRAIARDIAKMLGTVGYLSQLTREKVGGFALPGTISLEKLEEIVQKEQFESALQPVDSMLDDIPAWELSPAEAGRIRQGVAINAVPVMLGLNLQEKDTPHTLRARQKGKLVALCEVSNGRMQPVRVFK